MGRGGGEGGGEGRWRGRWGGVGEGEVGRGGGEGRWGREVGRGGGRGPGCYSGLARPPGPQASLHLLARSPSARPPSALCLGHMVTRRLLHLPVLLSVFQAGRRKKGEGEG